MEPKIYDLIVIGAGSGRTTLLMVTERWSGVCEASSGIRKEGGCYREEPHRRHLRECGLHAEEGDVQRRESPRADSLGTELRIQNNRVV